MRNIMRKKDNLFCYIFKNFYTIAQRTLLDRQRHTMRNIMRKTVATATQQATRG